MINTEISVEEALILKRVFRASPEAVFRAWTEPERVMRWWGPKGFTCPACQIDLRVGGVIISCMRGPDGRDYWSRGTYLEVDEPRRIVVTDSFADEQGNVVSPQQYGMSADWPEEALITMTFEEQDGQTLFTLVHAPIKPNEEREMCRQGWEETLDKLEEYLAGSWEQMPTTMRAAVIDQFGPVENIRMQEISVPEVGPDEILIHVESAGVGVWDPYEREGGFAELFGTTATFPYVMGSDGAGSVVAVGDRVDNFQPGDRVYAMSLASPRGGFYAEYIVAKADYASRVPDNVSTEEAGAMAVDAITALRGLDDTLHLKPGETIMIFGAGGGIGHLAVQLAKRMGARVFAVASGEDGVALAKELGADAAVDGRKDDVVAAARQFAPDGIDVALLTAGGEPAEIALTALRNGGRAAYPNGVEPEPTGHSNISIQSYDGMPDRDAYEKLNRLIQSGPFKVHIARTFSLDEAAEAHRTLDTHFLGKLTLRP